MQTLQDPVEPLTNGIILYGPGKGLKKMIFQGLDVTKKIVTKIVTIDQTRKKLIFIQPSEKSLYTAGLREKGVPGYLYIFAHAAPDRIQGITQGTLVAKIIRDSGIWNGEPVLIDACNAGGTPQGIASSLALSLRTYVTAPTTITWNYPFGGPAVGQGAFQKLPGILANLPFPDLTKPGHWRTWGPDGSPVSTTRTSPRDNGTPARR